MGINYTGEIEDICQTFEPIELVQQELDKCEVEQVCYIALGMFCGGNIVQLI